MSAANQIDQLLDQHGFQLLRQRKHKVYGHEDGRRFIRPPRPRTTEVKLVSCFGFVLDPIFSKLRTEQQWQDELVGKD
jgi:predicted RNA binding protein YcfA (HicA-like mRNA interferase family)